ncbi:uncharacterized protein LOC100834277 isoform X2 [Brachypodium distachyon]|uniref:Uncharacterized protein n=1 Tax=Brachypodium distachyon TaxID=15368 RepID=I1J2M1_BRADI|nr:uncharacterized protein LOC100834277 isoform X1 [Brachypodium distachyon]XP_014751109.1 uncharacterized protein LOC100834277 isoform X2 [Brachypodium distachyon]KQJ84980.1 hypothetical protein BRADI_5g24070v3 [Brachypodium distachyon]|eukprot:XP_003580692.1 uncharacterized protein LOC100834277 isoform X1 [Brachypodium distachyon]
MKQRDHRPGRSERQLSMVVHVALLAVPAAAGIMHAFQFSILVWPFNLVLPLLRQLPRCCATLRAAGEYYDAELCAYLAGRSRRAQEQGSSAASLRRVQRRPAEELVAHAMVALIDISY